MSKRRPSENTGLEEKIEKDFPYKKFPGEPHALIKKSDRLLKTSERVDPASPKDIDVKREKSIKGMDAKQTILKKKDQDLDNPRGLDRHSATGQPAFGKREKKGGGGVFNWGTSWTKEDFERPEGLDVETQISAKAEEGIVGENVITYDEYLQKSKPAEIKLQENDTKAKVSEEELRKQIGKATEVSTHESDDHKDIHHKPLPDDYKVGMATQHADLLGFKTGGTGEEEEATKEVKEKSEKEGTIKKAFHFVEEKLGLRPPSSQMVQGVFLQDDNAFPKLD